MITEASTKQALEFLLEDINSIIFDAWDYFQNLPDSHRMRFPRTRANIVWERIGINAVEKLSEHDNIKIVELQASLWFWVDDKLIFRFKKGDRAGYSRNYPTQQSLAYHDKQSKLIPDIQRVEIVYVLDKTETFIEDIFVVSRTEKDVEWMFSILDSGDNVRMLSTNNNCGESEAVEVGVAKLKKGIIRDNVIKIRE